MATFLKLTRDSEKEYLNLKSIAFIKFSLNLSLNSNEKFFLSIVRVVVQTLRRFTL